MSNHDAHIHGQLNLDAARHYADFFVPSLFRPWATVCCDRALTSGSENLLDVACGTGVVAAEAARRLGPGRVEGVDSNPAMLAVAAERAPKGVWTQADVHRLPYDDATFDAVVCQFGLMFFDDRKTALREMTRVVRPGGCLVIAVWASLEATPGYAAMVELLTETFGPDVGDSLRPPYALGDPTKVRALLADAGVEPTAFETLVERCNFESLDAWIGCDIRGWTLNEVFDASDEERLRRRAETVLRAFVDADDGHVRFDCPAHVVTVRV